MGLPFSESITKNGFTFISGQLYLTPAGELIEGTIEEQTHQIMKNLQSILEKEGLGFSDVVKTTIYTTDISLYDEVNKVYASYFNGFFPAREMIGVKELPLGARLEISMIASKN